MTPGCEQHKNDASEICDRCVAVLRMRVARPASRMFSAEDLRNIIETSKPGHFTERNLAQQLQFAREELAVAQEAHARVCADHEKTRTILRGALGLIADASRDAKRLAEFLAQAERDL
jgi:hypothetical protein